jgi:hypothetical protein
LYWWRYQSCTLTDTAAGHDNTAFLYTIRRKRLCQQSEEARTISVYVNNQKKQPPFTTSTSAPAPAPAPALAPTPAPALLNKRGCLAVTTAV